MTAPFSFSFMPRGTSRWAPPAETHSREELLRGQIGLSMCALEHGEAGNVVGRDEQRRLANVHGFQELRAPRTDKQVARCLAFATAMWRAVTAAQTATHPDAAGSAVVVVRECERVVALVAMLQGKTVAVQAALAEMVPWEPVPRALVVPAGAVSIGLHDQDAFVAYGARYELRTWHGTLHPVAVTERRLTFFDEGERSVECGTKRLLESADPSSIPTVVMAILMWTV